MKDITETEILQALADAMDVGDGGEDGAYTVQALAGATGKPPTWIRMALHEALRQGVWERCKIREENLSGIMQTKVAFRPARNGKKKK